MSPAIVPAISSKSKVSKASAAAAADPEIVFTTTNLSTFSTCNIEFFSIDVSLSEILYLSAAGRVYLYLPDFP
ncbi:hypothetical protein D3C76_1268950 [compost metagenome]